jgi:hypothetical protein
MNGLLDKLGQTWPAKMAQGLLDAARLPGQVAGGILNVPPSQPGMWSDEDEAKSQFTNQTMMNRAADLGGAVMGGSYGFAPPGVIGSGMVRPTKPMELFHGTRQDLKSLAPSKSGEFGPGVYLADDPHTASYFGGRSGDDGLNIMPMLADIQNPFTVTKQEWIEMTRKRTPKQVQAELIAKGHDAIIGVGLNGYDKQVVVFDPAKLRGKFAP